MKRILIPLIVVLFISSALFLIRGMAFRLLQKWADKTETDIDGIIIGSFRVRSRIKPALTVKRSDLA